MKVERICDRCKTYLGPPSDHFKLRTHEVLIDRERKWYEYDLCDSCHTDLRWYFMRPSALRLFFWRIL